MANRKVRKPNVVRGGTAIPLGRNYYYMSGRKHETGGIDIGRNPRTGIEVEDGEVMHIGQDEIKVFSAQPFLNGQSPAQRVMRGDNPNAVFNAQERFKKRNKLNDDGTKKKSMGGQTPKRKYTTTLTADEEKQFQNWYTKVSKYKNLNPNPDADGQDYDYRGYWKNEDRDGILGSNPNAHFTDKYKQPSHPTFSNESKYSSKETPGGEWVKGKGTWLFKHNKFTARQADRTADYLNGTGEGFILGTDTIIPNKRKRMGGLSRNKDYGSKSKPYPNVKSKDFAGRNRSYPIPTKADAKDALRLASLHGRSDVKAKVYRKYPELRKKARNGGLYSVTVNGITKLYQFPSTGGVQKTTITKSAKTINNKRKQFVTGGKDKENTEGITVPQVEEVPANFSIEQIPNVVPLEAIHFNNNQKTNRTKNNTSQSIIDKIKENPESLTDAIGLASNIGFSIAGNRMNNRFLNRMKYRNPPIPYQSTKLKTKININPQLDKMRESLAEYERNIDNNTASSRVALARKQRARLANVLQTNELFGTKENMETELINTDRLNQQTIANKNIENYNNWAEGENTFRNAILEKKAENNIAMANNINAGIQDAVNKFSRRKNEFRTISAMSLASPNLPAEMLYASGIWNKKMFDTYRKAYPLKGNKRTINSND